MAERVPLRGWRKIAAATWGEPSDPQIYGDLELDAGPVLAFIEDIRARTGRKVTVTHVVGKAVAYALASNPDLNARLHGGHMHRRPTVDVFFIVSAEAGSELSGVKVERADTKSVVDIAEELAARAGAIRSGADAEFGRTKTLLARTPTWLLRPMLKLSAWLTADLDRDLPALGLRRQSFGSVMVTSVGMFGVHRAYAPLSPYYRIPLLVLVGEVRDRPVAVDGQVVVRPMLTLTATMDHRYLDGFHAARLARAVEEYMADPAAHEPAVVSGTAERPAEAG